MRHSLKKSVSVWHGQEEQESNNPKQDNRIRLAEFIRENVEPIVSEWETFARTLKPAAKRCLRRSVIIRAQRGCANTS